MCDVICGRSQVHEACKAPLSVESLDLDVPKLKVSVLGLDADMSSQVLDLLRGGDKRVVESDRQILASAGDLDLISLACRVVGFGQGFKVGAVRK